MPGLSGENVRGGRSWARGAESGARQDGPSAGAPGRSRRGDLVLCPPGPLTATPLTATPLTPTHTVHTPSALSRCLGPPAAVWTLP